MSTLRTLAAAFALTLSAGAAWAGSVSETVRRSLPLRAGGEVAVHNVNGKVEVIGWDQDLVRLVAVKTARAATEGRARAYLDEVEVQVAEEDGRVVVRTRTPGAEGGLRSLITCAGVDGHVHYRLEVPRRARLAAVTVNGDVEVSGLAAPVRAASTNGSVTVLAVAGPVDATSINGSIRVDLRDATPDGDMDLSTVNGSIVLFVPSEFRGYVDARTTNGSVGSDLPLRVEGRRSRSRLVGSLNGGDTRLVLRTTNGSIWLRRP